MATEEDWKKIAKAVDQFYQRQDAGKEGRQRPDQNNDCGGQVCLCVYYLIYLSPCAHPFPPPFPVVVFFCVCVRLEPFRSPVAYKELGLLDYPTIISKPMDLGTIKKKLKDRQYSSPSELNADVTLVWTNCMTYNQVR